MRLFLAALSTLAALALPANAATDPPTASQLGALFCRASLSGHIDIIRPYLGPGLDHAFALAAVALPPASSGVPWQVFAPEAERCDVLYTVTRDDRLEIGIVHSFAERPGQDFIDVLTVSGAEFAPRIDAIHRVDLALHPPRRAITAL